MTLSNIDIKRFIRLHGLVVIPFKRENLQPASLDVVLDSRLLIPRHLANLYNIDPRKALDDDYYDQVSLKGEKDYLLRPGKFILGQTSERFVIPDNLVARIEGKSSLGRLGLMVHATAGFVDPGFKGNFTLEIKNASPSSIILYDKMPIAQVSFGMLETPTDIPYGSPGLRSKYQGQNTPTPSKLHEDYPKENNT